MCVGTRLRFLLAILGCDKGGAPALAWTRLVSRDLNLPYKSDLARSLRLLDLVTGAAMWCDFMKLCPLHFDRLVDSISFVESICDKCVAHDFDERPWNYKCE